MKYRRLTTIAARACGFLEVCFPRFGSILAVSIACVLLAGCAGVLAYRSGKELIAQDKIEAGLAKFQEAIARDPGNAEYKQAYLQARERAAYAYLGEADRLAAQGARNEADKLYKRVLAIDPGNSRARTGLAALERDERHARLVKEGQAALEKDDLAMASNKLAIVIKENPENGAARRLQTAIAERWTEAPLESTLAAAYRKPITIEFREAPLRQIFEVISRTSGLNFLFDKEVKTDQRTSIFLKNSTIESAVHFALLTNQLEQQVLDTNTVLIYPNTAAKQKDYQEMVVKTFYLANAEAKTVANTLKTILKSRDVVVDDKLNMLIVRDSPDAIKLAEKLVALHDVPEPEVMLEVEVLEVARNRLMELGVQWPTSLALTPLPSSSGGTLTVRDLRNLNSDTIGASVGATTIRARTEDGDANLLANPRIRARNHEKAKILIGERVPNITTTATSTGFVSESINYVEVGLKLDVEPTIYLNDDVAIKIALEVSSVTNQIKTQSGSIAYQIGTRTATTVLRLKDGENQVLAGLINDEERRTANKVPGLGELPVLGRLFGSTLDNNQKSEIVLSITPHLIRNISRPEAAMMEFHSGTESSFRLRPEKLTRRPATPGPRQIPEPATIKVNAPNTSAAAQLSASQLAPADTETTPDMAVGSSTSTPDMAGEASGGPSNMMQAQWQGPANVKPGETFTVQLMLQSTQPVSSVPMTIGFDSKALQVINVSEGTFLKQGGAQTTFTSQVDPAGTITLNSIRNSSGGASLPASGVVVSFRAIASAAPAQVKLVSIAATDPANQAIPAKLASPLTVQVK